MPYATREKVGEELDRSVAERKLEPVDYSDWAVPIVAVIKSDHKSVRICGDFRMASTRVQVESLPNTQNGRHLCNAQAWSWPTRPWARLHIDYAGPFQGKMILVLIDAHSKWIEATCTQNATSAAVIDELRSLFARFGLPETIISDNGTCFVSEEIEVFFRSNGIQHLTSAPYHPASNGLTERAVQTVKKGLKKITRGTMRTHLAQVLFSYRLTPQSTTGISPSELLLGGRPRSRLDLLKPNTAERVERNQGKQKKQHNLRSRQREVLKLEMMFLSEIITMETRCHSTENGSCFLSSQTYKW